MRTGLEVTGDRHRSTDLINLASKVGAAGPTGA
jgi:hypothetical protein